MVRLGLGQRQAVNGRHLLQPAQRIAVHRQGAWRQAPFHPQVLQKMGDALGQRRAVHTDQPGGSRRVSAAPAISPMRARNSVPISAL